MYKKLEYNMPEIIKFTDEDKMKLAEMLSSVAKKYNMKIQTCGNSGDYTQLGIDKSGCMTTEILSKANNIKFKKINHKGQRIGCNCMPNKNSPMLLGNVKENDIIQIGQQQRFII